MLTPRPVVVVSELPSVVVHASILPSLSSQRIHRPLLQLQCQVSVVATLPFIQVFLFFLSLGLLWSSTATVKKLELSLYVSSSSVRLWLLLCKCYCVWLLELLMDFLSWWWCATQGTTRLLLLFFASPLRQLCFTLIGLILVHTISLARQAFATRLCSVLSTAAPPSYTVITWSCSLCLSLLL